MPVQTKLLKYNMTVLPHLTKL